MIPDAGAGDRSGGRSSGAGYHFQDVYVAWQLAKLLIGGEPDPAIEVMWEKKVVDPGDGVARPVPMDDLIVSYKSGKWRYTEIKESGPRTVQALIGDGVAQQMWQQWQEATAAGHARIRLQLVTGRSIRPELLQLTRSAETARTLAELTSGSAVHESVARLAKALSPPADDPSLFAFLKTLEIDEVPSADEVTTRTVRVLESRFDAAAARDLASRLEAIVARSRHTGDAALASHTRDSLIAQLRQEGFSCEALRRRRAVPLWVAAGAPAAIVLAIAVAPFACPARWHRFADTRAAILPLATWMGSPLKPIPQSLADRRRERAQLLTNQLANQIEQMTGIRPLPPDLAAGIASLVAWDGQPCLGPEALDQVRRLTGVDYVLTGSVDPFDKPDTLTACLERTLDARQARNTWRLSTTPMETVGRDLRRTLRVSLASLRSWRSGDEDLYTRDTDDVLQLALTGMAQFQSFDFVRAQRTLGEATLRDRYFYLAHYAYSQVLQERGKDEAAQAEATKAQQIFEDRHGKSHRERALLQAGVLATGGDWKKAADVYLGLWHHDPPDFQAALLGAETENVAEMSDDVLQLMDQIRTVQEKRDLRLPVELDLRLHLEEAVAAGLAQKSTREERAAKAALAECPIDQRLLASRAQFLLCDAVVQQNEARPSATKTPWPSECGTAKKAFFDANDRISYGKLLQLQARSLRASEPDCALAKDRLAVDAFRAAAFERGLIDQLTNLVGTLTEPPFRASQFKEAGLRCNEAMERACDTGSLHLPEVLTECAYIFAMTGDLPRAKLMYTDAGRLARQRQDDHALAVVQDDLAYIEHALGRPEAAARLYKDSLDISARLGESDAALAETRVRYARLLSDLGNEARAADLYRQATKHLTAKDLRYLLADMQQVLAKAPNPPSWQRIAAHPSPPLPPPAPKTGATMECTSDDPLMPSQPDAGAALPADIRPVLGHPPARTLESCRNLPLPQVEVPEGRDDTR